MSPAVAIALFIVGLGLVIYLFEGGLRSLASRSAFGYILRSMAFFKRLIAIFLLLWLPLNPALALVMPFCQHVAVPEEDAHPGALYAHDAHSPVGKAPIAEKSMIPSCAQPALCHLASAPAVASLMPIVAADFAVDRYSPETIILLQFIPDRPERPPQGGYSL